MVLSIAEEAPDFTESCKCDSSVVSSVRAYRCISDDILDIHMRSGCHIVQHPSPLSASRGFFGNGHFKKANDWLQTRYGKDGLIDWCNLDVQEAEDTQ